ncbi:MAG TPA: twin-arginine translocase TatA/TatE family subunit [Planctomycetaceae bacterium]|nr:twin-arginine translocase TatA/TatE family subunit [Planctomycetaceae bacterium]
MFPMPGLPEMIVFGIIALLLFGKRLPEVARGLGKGIVEFKKGLRGIEEEVDTATYSRSDSSSSSRPAPPEERSEVTAPKFEPPTSEPTTGKDF